MILNKKQCVQACSDAEFQSTQSHHGGGHPGMQNTFQRRVDIPPSFFNEMLKNDKKCFLFLKKLKKLSFGARRFNLDNLSCFLFFFVKDSFFVKLEHSIMAEKPKHKKMSKSNFRAPKKLQTNEIRKIFMKLLYFSGK